MAPKGGTYVHAASNPYKRFYSSHPIEISLDAVGMTLIELILIWAARNIYRQLMWSRPRCVESRRIRLYMH